MVIPVDLSTRALVRHVDVARPPPPRCHLRRRPPRECAPPGGGSVRVGPPGALLPLVAGAVLRPGQSGAAGQGQEGGGQGHEEAAKVRGGQYYVLSASRIF